MHLPAPPACPSCGFEIFNRRYPRCESCGVQLPETLVYSPSERFALQRADDEQTAERARHAPVDDGLPFAPFDAAVVSGLVALSET